MNSVKELLQHMIERMSEAEAHQLLEFAQHLGHRRDDSLTLKRLATDPAFQGAGKWSAGLSYRCAYPWQGHSSFATLGG